MYKQMRMRGFSFFLALAVLLNVGIAANAEEVNEAYWTTDASDTALEKLDLPTGQTQTIRLKAEIPDGKTLMAYSFKLTYNPAKTEILSAVKDPEGVVGTSLINADTPGIIESNGFNTSGITGIKDARALSLIELTIKSLSDEPFGIITEFSAFGASTTDSFIPSVESLNMNTNIIGGWVNIEGNVLYKGKDIPLCTMVLANGEYMFTCNENEGKYKLFVPLDEKGQITLFCFCDGRAPFKAVLEPWQAVIYDVYMVDPSPYEQNMTVTTQFSPAVINPDWVKISGTVRLGDTPLCTMILANGQYMFTCGDDNGKYALEIPLDSNGGMTLFGFCDGLKPYKITLAPPEK